MKEKETRPFIRAYLRILGGPSTKAISRLVGLEPDRGHSKGDLRPTRPNWKPPAQLGKHFKWTSWELYANPKEYSFELEWYIADIARKIEGHEHRIRALDRRRFSVWLAMVIDMHVDGSTPAFGLGVPAMRYLARLGADLDIDTYIREEFDPKTIAALSRFKGSAYSYSGKWIRRAKLKRSQLLCVKPGMGLYHITK